MTAYPQQSETVFTTQELRLFARLRKVMDIDTIERLIRSIEDVSDGDWSRITIVIKNGNIRFIEKTVNVD